MHGMDNFRACYTVIFSSDINLAYKAFNFPDTNSPYLFKRATTYLVLTQKLKKARTTGKSRTVMKNVDLSRRERGACEGGVENFKNKVCTYIRGTEIISRCDFQIKFRFLDGRLGGSGRSDDSRAAFQLLGALLGYRRGRSVVGGGGERTPRGGQGQFVKTLRERHPWNQIRQMF